MQQSSPLDEVSVLAERIYGARRDLRPIPPVRDAMQNLDAELAYGIQNTNTERWLREGRRISGRKIGLTSKAVQKQLGVSEPDFGILWSDFAFANREAISCSRFMQPRIEAEIAFVLGKDLVDEYITLQTLVGAIEYAASALEIVDSAIASWDIRLSDTVADNASGGGYIIGDRPQALSSLDLRLCGMMLSRNGENVSHGVGAQCLGHPLHAALWLSRKMVAVGRPLRAGEIILSGALGPMVEVRRGDRFISEVAGFDVLDVSFGE